MTMEERQTCYSGRWELVYEYEDRCIGLYRLNEGDRWGVDALNEIGWSEENLTKKHQLFIPKKVRALAKKMHAEFFPSEELLPCPFCGSKASIDSSSGAHEVDCFGCGAYTWGETPLEAVKTWNRRVERKP